MSNESSIVCKYCKNPCRLIMSDVVTMGVRDGSFDVYNIWQCTECDQVFRELSGHKRIFGNNVIDDIDAY